MKRLSPVETFWVATVLAFFAIGTLDAIAAWLLGWHRPGWVEFVVGVLEGVAAGLVGQHFENRAEARDRSTS